MSLRVRFVIPLLLGAMVLAVSGIPSTSSSTAVGAAAVDTIEDDTGTPEDYFGACGEIGKHRYEVPLEGLINLLRDDPIFEGTNVASAQAGIVEFSPPNLLLRLQMMGSIPQSTEDFLAYGFAIDLDNNSDTGLDENGVDLWAHLSYFRGERQAYIHVGPEAIREGESHEQLLQATELTPQFDQGKLEVRMPIEALEDALPASYVDVDLDSDNAEMRIAAFTSWAPSDVPSVPLENPVVDIVPDREDQSAAPISMDWS